MISLLVKPEIIELIHNRQFTDLKEILIDWTPTDIAYLVLSLSDEEQFLLFRLLPKELAADVFEYLDFDPATSSAPFVATLVDVTGIVIYFTAAHFILIRVLLK